MAQLIEGVPVYIQGSGKQPYELKNTGGVYSCTCPAWRNQSLPQANRTCKHLKKHLGDAAEAARTGGTPPATGPAPLAPEKKVAGKTIAEVLGTDTKAILDRASAEGRKLRPDEKAKIAGAPVLLAHSYEDQDPAGWWWSEKLDGVRSFWDGKQFISRQGNTFHAPDWFKKGLPPYPLDGELWMGRGKFQETISVVKRLDGGKRWEGVLFVIFDMPEHGGTFEERVEALKAYHAEHKPPFATVLEHVKLSSKEHMLSALAKLEKLGAEGGMLREPKSKYEAGRSYTLLKVKSFKDAEATVLSYLPGKGRHKGVMGALHCRMDDGTEFDVGTGFSDEQRKAPPPVGARVTFRYQELSNKGVPRFPTFVSVRDYE